MENKLIKSEQLPLNEIMSIGKAFQESGMFPDIKSAAQAIVKIQAGQEIGISPFAAMTGIHIIQGKPSIGAGLIASKVKSSGKYDYKVKEMSDDCCSIDFYQGKELLGTSAFSLADAKKAGTQNTGKFPRNMLFARAISNGVKWFCPDVFNSPVYTPEDFNTEVTEDVQAEVTTPKQEITEAPKLNGHTNGLTKQSKELTEDELWQWQQSLNDCLKIEELTTLFNANKPTVNSEPKIYEMFKLRKQQLA